MLVGEWNRSWHTNIKIYLVSFYWQISHRNNLRSAGRGVALCSLSLAWRTVSFFFLPYPLRNWNRHLPVVMEVHELFPMVSGDLFSVLRTNEWKLWGIDFPRRSFAPLICYRVSVFNWVIEKNQRMDVGCSNV